MRAVNSIKKSLIGKINTCLWFNFNEMHHLSMINNFKKYIHILYPLCLIKIMRVQTAGFNLPWAGYYTYFGNNLYSLGPF